MLPRPEAKDIQHVGQYVRSNVIPSNLTVTEAAKLLGIGRPALSNFLNGRAKLSTDMALRLERVFSKADSQQLLDLQAEIDRRSIESIGRQLVTSAYAPSILTIRANEIEQWANRIESRYRLAVLLRKLVHSTGVGITHTDFPGHENAERHGWDGYVESDGQTPWIPSGASGWEFGTARDPRGKANRDYRARLASVSPEERVGCSFVFVTPRNWPGKDSWASEKSELGHWLAVRAYDASDLEQWVEQSVPAQVWLAEEIERPVTGYRSLEECWRNWADVTVPSLPPTLFSPAMDNYSERLKKWLATPPSSPLVIAADSKDEAIAFISCAAEGEKAEAGSWGSQAVVFETPESFQRLARSLPPNLVAISSNLAVEREMAPHSGTVHCIFVRPKGLVDSKPDITLDRLSHDSFRTALEEMDFSRDEIDRLDRESARSPTILRRRLSTGIIRSPLWAQDRDDEENARKLAPMTLVSAWDRDSSSDQDVLKVLARTDDYESVEVDIASLMRLDDSPVWRAGHHRGVISTIDSLFAIGWRITREQLDDFFLMAEYVLSEHDPSLELPPDRQWMAPIYDKVRNHSGALRSGICGALVLLAAHGGEVLGHTGLDVKARVDQLVRKLIVPSGVGELLSLHRDLPDLAEAAPAEFLSFLKRDLSLPEPTVPRLFDAEGDALFGVHRHTGLLWALERLAWDPENLPEVIRILAKLCPVELPSNLGNTPLATLEAIFRCWIPQTAATIDQRLQALQYLMRKYPEVGWALCIQQVSPGGVGKHNERPRWRSDASGAGYVSTQEEIVRFRRRAVELALCWADHNENTLGDLVDRVDRLTEEEKSRLWDLIESWMVQGDSSFEAGTELWKRLRLKLGRMAKIEPRMQAVTKRLQPTDSAMRNEWMFSWKWTRYPESGRDSESDYEILERRIRDLRLDALYEIWNSRGFEGVGNLIEASEEAPHFVGMLMPEVLGGDESLAYFVRNCIEVSEGNHTSSYAYCLRSVLQNSGRHDMGRIVKSVKAELGDDGLQFLFLCMPFRSSTWRLLDDESGDFRREYWTKVSPVGFNSASSDLNEPVDGLLNVHRPLEAFYAIQWYWSLVETSRLKRVLYALAAAEPYGHIDQFSLSSALDELDKRSDVTTFEKASLEFTYVSGLAQSEHGIPNLEELIASTPSVFMDLIEAVYGHESDADSQEPEELQRQARGTAAYFTLQRIRRTPGLDESGSIDSAKLKAWLTQVRALSAELSLTGACDTHIGELLSRAHADDDGYWPCRPVCEALEWMASENVREGFMIGVANSRGAMVRGRGGDQERELADKYRAYAKRTAYEYLFTSSTLTKLADQYDREAGWWDDRSEVAERLH